MTAEQDALKACELLIEAIEPCDSCEGTGDHHEFPQLPCQHCDGTGLRIASRGLLLMDAYPAAKEAVQKAKQP